MMLCLLFSELEKLCDHTWDSLEILANEPKKVVKFHQLYPHKPKPTTPIYAHGGAMMAIQARGHHMRLNSNLCLQDYDHITITT